MENSNRRFLAVLGVIALVGCICLGVIALGAGGLMLWNVQVSPAEVITPQVREITAVPTEESNPTEGRTDPSPEPETVEPVDPGEATESPTQPEATGEAELPQGSEPPEEIASQMDEIEQEVIALRGLQPTGEVDRALLTPAELREIVINDFFADYTEEEAREDTLVLAALGLLEPGYDFYNFYLELLSEQVAGFYDNETQKMYVIQDEGFKGNQRLTYAHEYVHALQDLNYDIENGLGYSDEACEEDSERCAAILALIEGDATQLEIEWFGNYATPQDAADLQEFFDNYKSPVYDSAPAFMQADFIFPYESGRAFVEFLYNQGGWDAVDQAYSQLPVSTEQIMHPERYPDDAPLPVDLPDLSETLGEGWRELDRGVTGEWYTYLILAHGLDPQARLEDETARTAADGWGGDAYVVYHNDETDQTALVLRTTWDSEQDAGQFSERFQEHSTARFGQPASEETGQVGWDHPGGRTEFRTEGDTTTWVLAPDAESAGAILEALPNP